MMAFEVFPETKSRRLALISLPVELMFSAIFQTDGLTSVRCVDMPADAKLVRIFYDSNDDSLKLVVESESFKEVPKDGCLWPFVPQFQSFDNPREHPVLNAAREKRAADVEKFFEAERLKGRTALGRPICRICKRSKLPEEAVLGPKMWTCWTPTCEHERFYTCPDCVFHGKIACLICGSKEFQT